MAPAPVAFATGSNTASPSDSPPLTIRRNFPETWLWLDHFSNVFLEIWQVSQTCCIPIHIRAFRVPNDGTASIGTGCITNKIPRVFPWDFIGFGAGGGGDFVMGLPGPPALPMPAPPPPPPSPDSARTAEIQIRSQFPETWLWAMLDAE
nr:unnamed protein product [Haemonchus contortus]